MLNRTAILAKETAERRRRQQEVSHTADLILYCFLFLVVGLAAGYALYGLIKGPQDLSTLPPAYQPLVAFRQTPGSGYSWHAAYMDSAGHFHSMEDGRLLGTVTNYQIIENP